MRNESSGGPVVDPITLEVIRCKLDAIVEDGAKAVIRNAISPIISEAADCSCAIYNVDGGLIMGGGAVLGHFQAGVNGVEAIRQVHAGTIADGDIFFVNDPHNGGGLHAQDVFIHMPVFVADALVAWVGSSGHVQDMGGMLPGSFCPDAVECYQEALRFPPVRLYRKGEEQHDIWSILRNNVRMANLVEMDARSLIAGAHVVRRNLIDLAGEYGAAVFGAAVNSLADLSEWQLRRRIAELAPGRYEAITWCEYRDKIFRVPCALSVEKDRLVFDFHGAPPQSQHFFNSKAYIVKSVLGIQVAAHLAQDLPYNEGIFRAFEVRCERGSILDAQAPAPVGGAHINWVFCAEEAAIQALTMAVAASRDSAARQHMSAPSSGSAMAVQLLSGTGLLGQPDAFLVIEGAYTGPGAGWDRDVPSGFFYAVGKGSTMEHIDIEVLESWHPVHITHRGPGNGPGGAGKHCAGQSYSMAYTVRGTEQVDLALWGCREHVPLPGTAGGFPGRLSEIRVRRAGGRDERLPLNTQGWVLKEGDTVSFDIGNGGGWGDPLDREPLQVESDVAIGRICEKDARAIFGVIPGDEAATGEERKKILAARLHAAQPAKKSLTWADELRVLSDGVAPYPLFIGVTQRGAVAVSERSGAPLAVSPDHWTDGCPVIRKFLPTSSDLEIVAYLDPATGYVLTVDVIAEGLERAFSTWPQRWMDASQSRAQAQ